MLLSEINYRVEFVDGMVSKECLVTVIILKYMYINQRTLKSSPISVTEFLSLHPSVDGTFSPPRKKARTDVSDIICLVLCLCNWN